ncbi:uncharacterized protein LOC133531888 isoform X2 [Cydia pomonella]|uniref:uncharacterized protein LOC133531888 isoform X2 n=1 Tax=Cydia pomonella TaxID=82600 RepID=UPI002ADDEF54|nr:uncharacterized protein LOC133531888 isoform X2 [Cydia pomonella]
MSSKNLMKLEKAMEYMEPMEVNDYLQKTLDFLKRNNSEVYFPSISPYVEAFLVNLVTDTRNLKSKAFKHVDRVLAEEIIEVLEMSREVFRWTHAYENGNTIADRLIQARASALRRPHTRAPLHHQEPNTIQPHSHATQSRSPNLPQNQEPNSIFKLRFLDKTLCFVKSTQTKLSYEEMPLSQAEYIYNLLKYRDKDVGFGYKSLYAPLWDAMEECGDCKFEVTLKETSRTETAVLLLEKVPKNSNKSKKDKEKPKTNNVSEKKNKDETHKDKNVSNSPHKENKHSNIQNEQSLTNRFLDPYYADAATTIPSLSLLSNVTEKFFSKTVVGLTEFADNENCKMKTFSQLSEGEIMFVKEVLSFAETQTVRDMFMPRYRILLWKLDRVVKEALMTCELTYTVIEKDRSMTWIKIQKSADAVSTSPNNESSALPPLKLLTNIAEPFFKQTIIALTEFADDSSVCSRTFSQLKDEEILFIKDIRQLAGNSKHRELFDPHYRDLLWRLNYSINEAAKICKITTSVNEKERSITLKKAPKFATPAPVPPKVQPNVATGARSKSMVPMKTRDRSLSKDRLIKFEKGGKPTIEIIDLTTDEEPRKQERGRSMSRRTAKLLEDLSTPVESDIGMRMMLLMGWQGGALGARGDGIMEPVMPNIDQPRRGGLGHVPPPKIVPRKPIDFRLMLLHNLLDFLLHDEWRKEILFKEPLVERERKFLHFLLTSVNGHHNIQLTEKENELKAKIYCRLADYPSMELRGDISKDLKTVTLQKLLDRPLRALNIKIPKPKNQNQPQNQPQPQPAPSTPKTSKADVDIVISAADVTRIIPHIDITRMEVAATPQAIRKRALRLLYLTKLAEALSWDWWERITFQYKEGGIPKCIITFMRTVVVHLNNGDRCLALHGAEAPLFGALLEARGASLAVKFEPNSKLIFTRTRIIKEESLPNNFPKLKVSDKNNDTKSVNNNQQVNNNIINEKITPRDKDTPKEVNTVNMVGNVESSKCNGIVSASNKIDVPVKDNVIYKKSRKNDDLDENNIFVQAIENAPKDVNNNKDDYYTQKFYENALGRTSPETNNVENKTIDEHKSITVQNGNLKDLKAQYNNNLIESTETKIEGLEIIIETDVIIERNKDKENYILMNIEEIKKEKTEFEADNLNIAGLSDLDKDIRDLEMTILSADADVACHVKTENDSNDCAGDLEMTISETDLSFIIKQENDDSNISGKRSHSNSICSQELDPKKTKINTESDENLVMIKPKNPDDILTEDIIKEVQTVMAKELDKAGGFLPLLKCHGTQNGGLMYSCHDEDDVAWIKKVISDANLDLEIVPNKDFSLKKRNRELLIKINSYIPLDTKQIFRKFEIYNTGLDTKLWKVSYKQASSTFVIFTVTVDEKSFKYISDENFSLYCGIDKAQFSIIY